METRLGFVFMMLLLGNSLYANSFGMSKVYLKQDDVSYHKKAELRQEMFMKSGTKDPYTNTIFVIQSDFELAEDITIPLGCALEFDGGCLRNGRLNTNGCYIDAGLYPIFDNIVFNSISTNNKILEVVDNIYIRVLRDNTFVNKKTNTVIKANSIVNRRYTYRIVGSSTTPKKEGNLLSITINGQKYVVAEINSANKFKLKYDYSQIIGIDEKGVMATGVVDSLKGITFYVITPLSYSNISTIRNKDIHPEWFGAQGDNVNDDSHAFNTALDLAYYSDSRVIIGNGIYRIDDALVIHTHTNLTGIVPTVEIPIKGCFSVNTDVAMLVFDKHNPSGSYYLDSFGFVPHSEKYKNNYIGIKVYHSQNHARISNIGFLQPQIGIDVDAIGGVQLLRCEDISLRGDEKEKNIALSSRFSLGGWFNANYFRPACMSHCTVMKCNGGGNNIIDGGATETNSLSEYLIELDQQATLIVRDGLYKETGLIARLQNSSMIIFEGGGYLLGNIDCDESSKVIYFSSNIQTRQEVINNSVLNDDVVIAHYKVFPKKVSLWYETVSNRVVKPIELASNYKVERFNGRLFASGTCKLPMKDVDIKGKTIVLRVISPTTFTSLQRSYPFILNEISGRRDVFSLGRSASQKYCSVLYAPGEINLGYMEKGERYVFIPSKKEKYLLNNFVLAGNSSFLISDIYVIDVDSKNILGNEELRIIDVLKTADSYTLDVKFQENYNKGTSGERPKDLSIEDAGFEYFDTTLHKLIYWSGDILNGDNGWIEAAGLHPGRN